MCRAHTDTRHIERRERDTQRRATTQTEWWSLIGGLCLSFEHCNKRKRMKEKIETNRLFEEETEQFFVGRKREEKRRNKRQRVHSKLCAWFVFFATPESIESNTSDFHHFEPHSRNITL
jgi:hypothetical protein